MDAAKLFGKGFPIEGQDPLYLFNPFGNDAETDGQRGIILHQTFENSLMCRNVTALWANLPVAEVTYDGADLVVGNDINLLPVDADIAVIPFPCGRDDGVYIFPSFIALPTILNVPPCFFYSFAIASLSLLLLCHSWLDPVSHLNVIPGLTRNPAS